MKRFGIIRPLLVALLLSGVARAEHVTDKLLAGLYAEPMATDKPIQVLPSGTPLEVLERDGDFTRVRLSGGTEGWIESIYVTDEKPARAMLLEAQVRVAELEAAATGECPSPESPPAVAPAPPTPGSGAALELALTVCRARTEALRQRIQQAANLLDQERPVAERPPLQPLDQGGPAEPDVEPLPEEPGLLPSYWIWIALPVVLVIGFAMGVGFVDYKIRKRYGGARLR